MELPLSMVEIEIRQRLGIPLDAPRVLVMPESSHWDPDWLFTSEEYFTRYVRRNLDLAIAALQAEPRRVYSVECMFFLRMYWERCPQQQETVRTLVNAGRLRLTSSGVTTADTIVPSAESVLRDFLIGQEWLRANGMTAEPRLAYFTDSFGCTPALPSLLNAAGFDRTALTRLDGMYFVGCDLESARHFPRKGSSAERLSRQERSADFIWRDQQGARLLCHWNAFNYGQGDMLAYSGISRVYLANLAFPARSDRHVASRIQQYVRQLAPLSRTPYLLCPIGMDFIAPIPHLTALLDRYNRNHYPQTGVWAVNAGLDDYLDLIEPYQARLPVVELDPNPYWTGFYSARPTLKRRCRELADKLLLAEALSLLPGKPAAENTTAADLERAWWLAAASNHHDFVTGTSPDRVVEGEQIPWLEEGLALASRAIERLDAALPGRTKTEPPTRPVAWSQQGGRVTLQTAYYQVELAEEAGGAIVRLADAAGQPLLAGASNEPVCYRDSGGLWRMGMEFAGGVWKERWRGSAQPARLAVRDLAGGLEISSQVTLGGEPFVSRLWLRGDSPLIFCRLEGKAPLGHSVTVRLATGIQAKTLWMDTSGGMIARPLERIYRPTFWSLHTFIHLQGADGRGLAVIQALPGAAACQPDGTLELVAMRNAPKETAYGFIGLPANPARGSEREPYAFAYALLFTPRGGWQENDLPRWLQAAASSPWRSPDLPLPVEAAGWVAEVDNPEVWVSAVKPAARGEGIIVRLNALAVPAEPLRVSAKHFRVTHASLCDARERDLRPLEVREGAAVLSMPGTIASVRLVGGAEK